jgi:ferredoxin
MRVVIDEKKCCGAGRCVVEAPTVFDQRDADGVVILLQPHPAEELHENVRRAAQLCPALAIDITDEPLQPEDPPARHGSGAR